MIRKHGSHNRQYESTVSIFKTADVKLIDTNARKDKRIYRIIDAVNDIRAKLWDLRTDGVEIEIEDKKYIIEMFEDAATDVACYNRSQEEIEAWLNGKTRKPYVKATYDRTHD